MAGRNGGVREAFAGFGRALWKTTESRDRRPFAGLLAGTSSIFLYAAAIGATEPAAAAVIFECRTLFLVVGRRMGGGKEGDKFLRRSPPAAYALLAVALAGAGAVQVGARGWEGGAGLGGLWWALAAALADATYQERSLRLAEAAPEPRLRLAWCAAGLAAANGVVVVLSGAALLLVGTGSGLDYPVATAAAICLAAPLSQLAHRRANLGGGNLGANALRFAGPALAFVWLALYGVRIASPPLFAAGAAVIGAAVWAVNRRGRPTTR